MAKRQPFTFESNIDKVIPKIHDAPHRVLNIIGQNLVREIRPSVPKRTGRLRKSLGYWARKKERDLQIGFKIFYAPFVYRTKPDPIKPVAVKNAALIQRMIAEAMTAISRE